MFLPNVDRSVTMFSQWLVVHNNVQSVVNNLPVQTPTTSRVLATVQRVRGEELKIGDLDFSLKYLVVHTLPVKLKLVNGKYVDRNGNVYVNESGSAYLTRGLPEHLGSSVKINDTCDYNGANYKCIDSYYDADYEFIESTFEEIRKPFVARKK